MTKGQIAKTPVDLLYEGYVCHEADRAFSESIKEIGALLPKELYKRHAAHYPIAFLIYRKTASYSNYSGLETDYLWRLAEDSAATVARGFMKSGGELLWCGTSRAGMIERHAEAVKCYGDIACPDAVIYSLVCELLDAVEPARYDGENVELGPVDNHRDAMRTATRNQLAV